MDRVYLKDLNINTRNEMVIFLKSLWNDKKAKCLICGNELELLHKKKKKNDCDWQCKNCNKIYRTIHLLCELNEQMPN